MTKSSETIYSVLKLAALLVATAVVTGCVSAKTAPLGEQGEPSSGAPGSAYSWTVVQGDHLWGIAGSDEVYNVSEKWPLIYKSNLNQIEDADLIFPGQVLKIPQDSSQSAVDAAVRHAKSRGAWAVGPVEISDKEYLKTAP